MEEKKILISVIVPVYKVEQYLSKCIDSIIHQTYQHLEIILVDDGSPDRCGEICDEYAAKDSRIKVIHKENAGVNEARITGFKGSKGEYITFVDADDYISPLYVERLYNPILEENIDMSCVQWTIVKRNHLIKDKRIRQGFFNRQGIEDILKKDFLFDYKQDTTAFNLGLCCKMIKRKYLVGAMEQAEGLWMGEDLISNLCLLYSISSMCILDEFLYYYVQHGKQSTRSGSLNAWINQVEQWNRILKVDINRYLESQLPYRILMQTKFFVRNNVEDSKIKAKTFAQNMSEAVKYDVVGNYFIKYDFHSLNFQDKLFVYLIKKKSYIILYYTFKVAIPLRRCLLRFKTSM